MAKEQFDITGMTCLRLRSTSQSWKGKNNYLHTERSWTNMENHINIRGMTCAACARWIEKAVKKLPGIVEANVNLTTEKLFVECIMRRSWTCRHQRGCNKNRLRGIRAEPQSECNYPDWRDDLCGLCPAGRETLKKMEGITEVSVNFATEKQPLRTSRTSSWLSAIRGAIEKVGYQVLRSKRPIPMTRIGTETKRNCTWTNFTIAAVFCTVALYCDGADDSGRAAAFHPGLTPCSIRWSMP